LGHRHSVASFRGIPETRTTTMDQITELWALPWGDGLLLTFMLMALYTYKVWIDNKFKK